MTQKVNSIISAVSSKKIEPVSISDIDLDAENPRFGSGILGSKASQPEILDFIVRNFGVDDVLSSVSVNGYFSAEPLVLKEKMNGTQKRYVVLEGNRRLAAMLILSGDARAHAHKDRTTMYATLHANHGSKEYNPVPSIVFTENEDFKPLLSYLGVRHIVSTKDWDSFAKANWVYNAVTTSNLDIDDISLMTGDRHQTIKKLLQGFHFIRQLEREGLFIADNSNKGGRGSNTKYPFSWVYTILGYQQVKSFVNLPDNVMEVNPIPNDKLNNAALIVKAMFGDKSKGTDSQVGDSRNLSKLASAVATPEKVWMLQNGHHVNDIDDLTKAIDERLRSIMFQARELFNEANGRLVTEDINATSATEILDYVRQVHRQLQDISQKLKNVITKDQEDDI